MAVSVGLLLDIDHIRVTGGFCRTTRILVLSGAIRRNFNRRIRVLYYITRLILAKNIRLFIFEAVRLVLSIDMIFCRITLQGI